jgi:hypothetical protein
VCYYEEETGIFCFFFPSQLFRVCSFDFVFVVKSAECSVAVYLKRSLAPKCQVSLSLSALCCSALFFFPEKVLDNKQQKSVTTKKQKKIYIMFTMTTTSRACTPTMSTTSFRKQRKTTATTCVSSFSKKRGMVQQQKVTAGSFFSSSRRRGEKSTMVSTNAMMMPGAQEIAQLADWDEETITTVVAAVLGIGAGLGIPIFFVTQEKRDKERIEEIRELNRATLKATGEQMSEEEIRELRPNRYLDRREFKDDD